MSKNQFWRQIRVEEYFLGMVSLFLIVILFVLNPNWLTSFNQGIRNILLGLQWFALGLFLFFLLFFFHLYLDLVNLISKLLIKRKISLKKLCTESLNALKNNLLWPTLFIVRLFIPIAISLGLLGVFLGYGAEIFQYKTADDLLLKIDYQLLGFYPAFSLFRKIPQFLTPFFVFSFCLLGSLLGITLFIFYLQPNKFFLKKYILSIFLAVLLALPIWFIFPAHSPQNAYLNHRIHLSSLPASLNKFIQQYQPPQLVKRLQEKIGAKDGELPPITTCPSMHVAWGLIIVFYLAQWKKRTLWITLPWFGFCALSTVYLAQHYFIDIPGGLTTGFLAIYLGSKISKIENQYYQESPFDKKEKEFKQKIINLVQRFEPLNYLNKLITGRSGS